MPLTSTLTRNEARIREIIDEVAEAIRDKDLDALMAHYAPDTVTFDLIPLQSLGKDAYRENFEAWFGSVQGPIGFEVQELQITLSGNVGYCHCLTHVTSTRKTGAKNDYQARVTAGLRKMTQRWLITHEHVSVPFISMEAMQHSLASQPAG